MVANFNLQSLGTSNKQWQSEIASYMAQDSWNGNSHAAFGEAFKDTLVGTPKQQRQLRRAVSYDSLPIATQPLNHVRSHGLQGPVSSEQRSLELRDVFSNPRADLERLRNAMKKYETQVPEDLRTHVDFASKHTWTDVIQAVEAVRVEHSSAKGFRERFRQSCSKALTRHAAAILTWVEILPSQNEFFSPICGGLKLIFGAAAKLNELRNEIYVALEQMPTLLDQANIALEILVTLNAIVNELRKKALKRTYQPLLEQDTYGQSLSLALTTMNSNAMQLARAAKHSSTAALLDTHEKVDNLGREVERFRDETRSQNMYIASKTSLIRYDQVKEHYSMKRMSERLDAIEAILANTWNPGSATTPKREVESILMDLLPPSLQSSDRVSTRVSRVDVPASDLSSFLSTHSKTNVATGPMQGWDARTSVLTSKAESKTGVPIEPILDSDAGISVVFPRAESNADTASGPSARVDASSSALRLNEAVSHDPPSKTQSVDHISWMTRRVDTLEEELRRIRTEAFQRNSAEQQLDEESAASHDEFDRRQSLETRTVSLDEFRCIKEKYGVTKGNVVLCAMAERREVSVQISAVKETMLPYRLAINSHCLLDLLSMFHKTSKLYNVHLRPFKFLICYRRELEQKLEHLKIQCQAKQSLRDHSGHVSDLPPTSDRLDFPHENVSLSPDDTMVEIDGADLEKKQRLRDHLGSLIRFIHVEMDEIFQRRKILDEAGQDEILFEDLYHLFRPGQLIYTNPGQDPTSRRAYRVLHVTGGRPIRDLAGNLGVDKDGSEPGGKLEIDLFRFSPESAGQTQQQVPGTTCRLSPLLIDCVYTDFDGEYYTPKSLRFVMLEYEGTKPIRHLDIYPEQHDRNPNETQRMLTERGEKFVSSAATKHKTYDGRPLTDRNVSVEHINSEVILDHGQVMGSGQQVISGDEFLEEPSKWDRREAFKSTALDPAVLGTDLWWDYEVDERLRKDFLESEDGRQILVTDHAPTKEQLILLPVRIWGYVLTERKWYQLNINNISDVQRKSDVDDGTIRSFNDLVLRPQHKKLIQALVTNQMWLQSANLSDKDTSASQTWNEQYSAQKSSINIVRGKGRGLIVLLHGVPGVGKTSTAECIAAQLGRPLFPITCGDLGTDAQAVENKLDTFFYLAQKWKCVLLLDEADVFLTRRSTGDFVRNGIVSVFLRVLETFTGVLILTTNRVGEFDEAFRSRIHVSILYPRLDERSTLEIFDVNLRRIKYNQTLDVDIDQDAVREFGRQHFRDNEQTPGRRWTGRQIKNAFQTAIALANWDYYDQGLGASKQNTRPTIKARHFEYIAERSADFDEYLDQVHHSSESGWASEMMADHRLRKDDFDSLTPTGPERQRSSRGKSSVVRIDSVNPLALVATEDDNERKRKKIRSKLKNLYKLNLQPEKEDWMRLELISELDELQPENDCSTTDADGWFSRRDEEAPWA